MGSFDDAVTLAMDVWFGADMADPMTYNGSDIPGQVLGSGTEQDANSVFDFLDVEVKASDVPAVTYLTDTLVHNSLTWKYPRVTGQDAYTKKIRFIRNQRPKVR